MNKKHYPSICLPFLILIVHFLNAQVYHPMPENDAEWRITRCWSFYPGGWHDEYSITLDGSDTIINGKTYTKLYLTTHHLPGTEHDSIYTNYLGAMRQSGKQVFFISEYMNLDTIERLVYDFNEVDPGDTIYTQVMLNGLTLFVPHIVVSVDSVLVGNEYHRRINLTDENGFYTESWIEGIGSDWGLVYASYWVITDNSYDLNCFYNENELEFTNTSPGYEFCSSPQPDIVCDSVSTAIPAVEYFDLSIFPNPANEEIRIEFTEPIKELSIYSGTGQLLMKGNPDGLVDVHSLEPGIYFILIKTANGQVLPARRFVRL